MKSSISYIFFSAFALLFVNKAHAQYIGGSGRGDAMGMATGQSPVVSCPSPLIILQPHNEVRNAGSDVVFAVAATGADTFPVTYRWQQDTGSGFNDLANTGAFSGATDDTLNITALTIAFNATGYRCIVTKYGCTDTSDAALLTVNTPTALRETAGSRFSVYPNPAGSHITVSLPEAVLQGSRYTIYDRVGRNVMSALLNDKETKIDVEKLEAGFYLISIDAGGAGCVRFVKF